MRNVVTLIGILGIAGCYDSMRGERDAGVDIAHDIHDVPVEPASVCGNGSVEGEEECDDGAWNSDTVPDACRTDCIEAHCGDGVADTGEECDGEDVRGESCESLGHIGGTLLCDDPCLFYSAGCHDCGNGTCDAGEDRISCPSDCYCGDGVCDETEDQFDCLSDCGAVAISAADEHVCVLLSDGTIRCWGDNEYGQLGNETHLGSSNPVAVSRMNGAVAISVGGEHSCSLLPDGTAWCWGFVRQSCYTHESDCGGIAYTFDYPVFTAGLEGAVAISAGGVKEQDDMGYWIRTHSCALVLDGTARCWGEIVEPVPGIEDVVSISAGGMHTCAVLSEGTVWCWGSNSNGQLGDGTDIDSDVPVLVSGLTTAVSVSAGGIHSCAVLSDGTARCWGNNGHGQLGDGTNTHSHVRVSVSGLSSAVTISAGLLHTCALLSDGTAKCWGSNSCGELGDGTGTSSNIPVPVSGLAGTLDISTGWIHLMHDASNFSCALISDGTVKCWGKNDKGQLGDGTNTDSNIPVQVAEW